MKHIKHRDAVAHADQQLSRLFHEAQTPRLPIVQLMFIDDYATYCQLTIELQNATTITITAQCEYASMCVNSDMWSVSEHWT